MENRYLLISDVDGTLLGDNDSLEEFADWYERQRDRLRLVYNSGRLVDSVQQSINSTQLPEPDAIIGGVGTQVWCYESRTWIDGWPDNCDGWHPSRIRSLLAEYRELRPQPDEFQAEFKISYFADNAPTELLEEIQQRLTAESCRVELVYSSNRDLDVLPRGVNKGSASAFLATRWSVPDDRVIVSGDSGNDLAMFNNGFRGVVVGNAHHELKRLTSPDVFQSDRHYAAGVLQGLSHWMETCTVGLASQADRSSLSTK